MNFWQQFAQAVVGGMDAVIAYERKRAYNNRIRKAIDGEEKNINRAYIALGKHYYKNLRPSSQDPAAQTLCKTIDQSRAREQAARKLLQITVQGRKQAGSVAIIGGVDGPTAIYLACQTKKKAEAAKKPE